MFLSWATSSIMNVSRSDEKKKERTSSLKTCGQFHEPHRYGASMKRELPSRNIGRSTSLLPEAPLTPVVLCHGALAGGPGDERGESCPSQSQMRQRAALKP